MHDELEAMGGRLEPDPDTIPIMYDVVLGVTRIGAYWFDSNPLNVTAVDQDPYGETKYGLPSERAAVDWILGRYFLARSLMQTIPSHQEPHESPEFPVYYDAQGREHAEF